MFKSISFSLLLPALVLLAPAPVAAAGLDAGVCAGAWAQWRGGVEGAKVSGTPAGIIGESCAFDTVTIQPEDPKAPRIRIARLMVGGSALLWAAGRGGQPRDLSLHATGLRVDPVAGSGSAMPGGQLAPAAPADLELALSWDPSSGALRLVDLDLEVGESRLTASGDLGRVSFTDPASAFTALVAISVTRLDLDLTSRGLFASHVRPHLHLRQGQSPDAALEAAKAEIIEGISLLPAESAGAGDRAALSALFTALPRENGRLTLGLAGEPGLGLGRVIQIALREQITGTRLGTADLLSVLFGGIVIRADWTAGAGP